MDNIFGTHTQFSFLGKDIHQNKFSVFLLLLITTSALVFSFSFLFLALNDYFNQSLMYVIGSFLTLNIATAILKSFFSNRNSKYIIGRLIASLSFIFSFYYCYIYSLAPTNYILIGLILFSLMDCINFKKVPNTFLDLIKN